MAVSTRVYWPSMSDYQEAVQSPTFCFSDSELKKATAIVNALGLPRPMCGAFASVYEFTKGHHRWAIKCFLRNIPDQHDRYAKIAAHLDSCNLPYFVTFDYQQKGIMVQGKWFPLVKMEWVEGTPLNLFVEGNLKNSRALLDLEQRWTQLLEELESVSVAHGDLQHGNVLVSNDGSLKLIDYDGMWVPQLKGEISHETGHPDYQSPLRTEKDFDSEIDWFSGDLIQVAIRIVSQKPGLWQQYNNGENMLFKRRDFMDIANSKLIAEIEALGDSEVQESLQDLIQASSGPHKRTKAARTPAITKTAKAAEPPKAANKVVSKAPAARGQNKPAVVARKQAKRSSSQATPGTRPAAPQASAAPAGGNRPSWMNDHVAVYRGGPPAPSAPKSGLRRFRAVLHTILLVSIAFYAIPHVIGLIEGDRKQVEAIWKYVFDLAAVLGLVSFLTLLCFRGAHRAVGTLFFGLTAAIMVVSSISTLAMNNSSASFKDDLLVSSTLLAVAIVGFLVTRRSRL